MEPALDRSKANSDTSLVRSFTVHGLEGRNSMLVLEQKRAQAGAVQGDIDEMMEALESEGVIFEPDGIFRYALVDPDAAA